MAEEKYTCEACNQLGCSTQTYALYVTHKLQKPDIGLWDTYSDSAKFYVSFQKEATHYLFEYFFLVYEYNWTKPFKENFTVGWYLLSSDEVESKYEQRKNATGEMVGNNVVSLLILCRT